MGILHCRNEFMVYLVSSAKNLANSLFDSDAWTVCGVEPISHNQRFRRNRLRCDVCTQSYRLSLIPRHLSRIDRRYADHLSAPGQYIDWGISPRLTTMELDSANEHC
ncbi:hypothetical protein AcW1_003011 [Taiwanofungus camphoratus]|nr:hypothetical protein AcW1_003011 [Antrodia cinnamomea]